MTQVNSEGITKQLYRAYNARGILTPNGAQGLSPVFIVGAGAHPALAHQIQGVMTAFITAAAGVTGGVGLINPVNSGALIVVNAIQVAASATAASYTLLLDGPNADTDYSPTQFPTNRNTQNVVKNVVPGFWGYTNTAASPVTGSVAGTVVSSGGSNPAFAAAPLVLLPGWGVVMHANANALNYGCDISFDAFELSPT